MSNIEMQYMWDNFYPAWLQIEIDKTKKNLSTTFPILKKYKIIVSDEQMFIKENQFLPNTIFVIVKKVSSTIVYSTIVQPYQIIILAEQNTLEVTKTLFNQFANEHNFELIKIDETKNICAKAQYSEPIIMQNFTNIGAGFRSVCYMSVNLFIMKDIMDITDLYFTLDDGKKEKVEFISADIGYVASGDTQQFPDYELSKTIKTTSGLTLTLLVPSIQTKLNEKSAKVVNGSILGNTKFHFNFTYGGVPFESDFILSQCSISSQPNNIPGLTLTFQR